MAIAPSLLHAIYLLNYCLSELDLGKSQFSNTYQSPSVNQILISPSLMTPLYIYQNGYNYSTLPVSSEGRLGHNTSTGTHSTHDDEGTSRSDLDGPYSVANLHRTEGEVHNELFVP
jgi:hypothetical protein